MINYIKAELYRNFNRLYFWMFTACLAGFCLFINSLFKIYNAPVYSVEIYFEGMAHVLVGPIFMVVAFMDMITAEEQKNLTIRNVVSFGMNRSKIVLSKFTATVILAFISEIIILAVLLGSAVIFFGVGTAFSISFSNYMIRFGVATVLWVAAIALGTLLSLIIKNSTIFAFVYSGIFIIINQGIKILMIVGVKNLDHIYNSLITTRLSMLSSPTITSNDLSTSLLIGVMYTIIFLVLGIICFNKQEVK